MIDNNKSFSFLETINQLDLLKRLLTTVIFIIAAFTSATGFAQSSQPQFALTKNICTGNAANIIASGANPASCPLATSVTAGTPVYFVITVTNPWGQPPQQVNLTDALPAGFTQSGAIVCRDDSVPTPQVITLGTGNGANSIGTVPLAIGATVNCFIQGQYANPPSNVSTTSTNTVNANNGGATPFNMTASVATTVVPSYPLATDLSVTKSSSAPINIANGASSITYTIVIKNNGPNDVNVADYFTLQDNLSLPTNGVPLNVEYASSNCVATTGTSCLATGGPTFSGASPLFVGATGQTNFFSWGFDAGNGLILNGGEITLTITANISQVPGLNCVVALNAANGLVNQTFFTLANSTTAYTELTPANNTSSVLTVVDTGQTAVDPDCGKAHIRMKKVQISPPPGTIVPWGTKITYAITIENISIPEQEIRIDPGNFQDWVTEGLNTPPFTRRHVNTSCVASTDPSLCSNFTPGFDFDPDYKYKFYGEANKAWNNSQKFLLKTKESVTFNTTFVYERPDCETVPNTKSNLITNTARLNYMASVYGAVDASQQDTSFSLQASAQTNMEKVDACNFVVTKKITLKPKTTRIQFGVGFSYDITYTNNGAARTIGTLLDVVRLTIPNYASSVPYTSDWKCSATNGITGATLIGSVNGSATYTNSPAQGSPAANLGTNIFFPAGATLTCHIDITVNRPTPNDKFCTQDKAEFENLALMDVTNPFNPNIAWPPSSAYNPNVDSNPVPQNVNWAAVKAQLPACWDATVNKSATVVGLPTGSAPWTYNGGPAINYVITTTNKGQSTLGNSAAPPAKPQWLVVDNFTGPDYLNINVIGGTPLCDPSTPWCHSNPNLDPKSKIAIKTLAPLNDGKWNLQYPGPFLKNKPIENCTDITPDLGADTPNYYQNTPPTSTTPTKKCVTIPVVDVTSIKVTKTLVDNTGANVKAGGPFGMNISCSPYAIPSSVVTTFSLSTDSSGTSPTQLIYPVARSSSNPLNVCTLTETSTPIPPASALACGGAANVDVIAEYQDAQGVWKPMPDVITPLNDQATGNNITVRNTLKCKIGTLNITKVVTGPTLPAQYANIAQNYTINAACGVGNSTNLPLIAGASGTVTAPVNTQCTISEIPPLLPQNITDYCTSLGQKAVWEPVVISPGSPVTVVSGSTSVTVTNQWKCAPQPQEIHKVIAPGPGGVQLTNLEFTIQSNCTPNASSPAFVKGTVGASTPTPYGTYLGTITTPIGSTCALSEPAMPTFPPAAFTQCGTGNHPEWASAVFDTTSHSSIHVIKVTNSWSCVPDSTTPKLRIFKKVIADIPAIPNTPPPSAAMAYQFTAPCLSTTATVNVAGGVTGGAAVFDVTPNTSCLLEEILPPIDPVLMAYCGTGSNPGIAVWGTPTFSPSNNPTITAGITTVTVTNRWQCLRPTVVKKVVQGPIMPPTVAQPPSTPAQNYAISANCSDPSGVVTPYAFNLSASGSTPASGTLPITLNSQCTFTESMPISTPPVIAQYCNQLYNGNNGNPYVVKWEEPDFSPSKTVGSNVGLLTVTNKWKCVDPTIGTVKFYKLVHRPSGLTAPYWSSIDPFTFEVANATPQSVTLSAAGNVSAQYSATMTLATGSSLSVVEKFPPFQSNINTYCSSQNGQVPSWKQPFIVIHGSNQVTNTPLTLPYTIQSGDEIRIIVSNEWECVASNPQGGSGINLRKINPAPVNASIELVKQISGPSPVANNLNFIVTANCTPASTQGRINILTNQSGTGSVKIDVPNGAQCSFAQTRPPLPAAAQEFCAKLERQPAQWNEVLPFASATAGQRLVLQDSWKCVGSPPKKIVIPPPVPVAPSPIKQPPGRHSDVLK
jgi:uncharacterized repeat protein (TIGR01451 family)